MTRPVPRKRQATWRAHDRLVRSTCGNCPAGCGVKGFLDDERLVDLFGDEDHPGNKGSYCPKGLLSWVLLDHPDRVTTPRLRESLDQPFREVSWEEALRFAGDRLRGLTLEHGADAVAVLTGEIASFGAKNGARLFAEAIGTANGPDSFVPPAFGPSGRLATMFGVPGARLLMNSQRDWANSRCLLVVGSDPGATDPVTLGPLVDVRDRGGALVVIDSKTTITAVKASYFVRVKPGTEAVLLAAVAAQLIAANRVDRSFINECTSGFERFRDAVAAVTPEMAMAICGVAQGDIDTLVRVIGEAHPMQVMCGDWSSRQTLSDELLALCGGLVCLRGSVGIPGGGLNILGADPFAHAPQAGRSLERLLQEEGGPAALICHGNPIARLAGGQAVRDKIAAMRIVVQIGGGADETSTLAHVQLPPTTWLEEDGLLSASNTRAVQWQSQLAVPRGDSRPSLDIFADLADACAAPIRLAAGARGVDLATAVADAALSQEPMTRAMTAEALDPNANVQGGILWPCRDTADIAYEEDRFIRGDVRGQNILFRRNRAFPGTDHRFPTKDGDIDLAAAAIDSLSEDATVAEGDLVMIATPAVDYIPGWSGLAPNPMRPAEPRLIRIHPATADRLGLRNGSAVTVSNDLGAISGRAQLSLTVPPHVVWCIETPGPTDGAMTSFALFPVPEPGMSHATATRVTVRPADS